MKFKKFKKDDPKWELVKDHPFCTDMPNPFLQVLYEHRRMIPNLKDISYFIETGTYLGHSASIFSECFDHVFTVEKEKNLYEAAKASYDNIAFILGDSGPFLKSMMIAWPDTRFVFLLDAHTGKETPILTELAAIELSHRRDHVIIIDDTKDIDRKGSGWPNKTLFEAAILGINPNYNIEYTPYGNRICIVYEEDI